MKLVIAEKPSVAQSIAKVLNAEERKDGYFFGNGYVVSWCVGHLVALAPPENYNEAYKKWDISSLPIIPQNWEYILKEATKGQFNILKKLMADNNVTSIVCATDAGREGELIFRHTYNKANCHKPVERLWISSLEDSAIKKGFENLKDSCDYDNLYYSALCRERADWLVGMNFTRLFTKLYDSSKPLNIGRVQTPTLAMIVERDNNIATFKKEKYYKIELDCGDFKAVSDKIVEKNNADDLATACNNKQAIVTSVVKEEKKVSAPKLYDLTTLQRDANRLLGFTAQQTLEAVQRLYDNKLSTYPRTDSQYLTEDMETTAREVIEIVLDKFEFANSISYTPNIDIIMNNKKVSDHHAIIPTANIAKADLSAISDTDRKILCMIANRLLVATAEKHIFESTNVTLKCCDSDFFAKGKIVIQKGFKEFEDSFKSYLKCKNEDKEAEDKILPPVIEQQTFMVSSVVTEHFTVPPKPYTEDTLLSAMERAGNSEYDTDEVERKGLGTPATRASIIEKIISTGYAERNKNQIVSTEKGRNIIKIVPEKIKSASMTADWENRLVLISKGQADRNEFINSINTYISTIISDTQADTSIKESINSLSEKEVIGKCPRCGAEIYEGKLNFYCSNKECQFALWKKNKFFESKKKTITKAVAKKLLSDGKVHFKDLYSEKTNKTYEADILLDDTGEKYVNFKLEFNKK